MLQSQLEVTMPLTSKHHMRYHSHVLHFFVKHVGFICLYSSLNMVPTPFFITARWFVVSGNLE